MTARFFFTHGTVPVLLKAAAGGGSGLTRLLATMKLQRSVDMCFPSVAERTPSHARKWNNKMHKFSGVWKKELAGLTRQWCDDASTSPFKSAEGRRVKETVKAAAATKKKTQSSLKAPSDHMLVWFVVAPPRGNVGILFYFIFIFLRFAVCPAPPSQALRCQVTGCSATRAAEPFLLLMSREPFL